MLAVASDQAEAALKVLRQQEEAKMSNAERDAIEAVEQLDGETCPACLAPLPESHDGVCPSCGLRFA